jgi:iron transport multicopper oxidase
VPPKVPTLYTAATTGEYNTDPVVYGGVHPFIVSYGDVVDIVVNNNDRVAHPFHLHGHHFQVLSRPATGAGNWTSAEQAAAAGHGYNAVPPWRDTVVVMPKSHAVLRFLADNPGVYLFHCHIEWHVESGLSSTIIEAPERLRGMPIPQDHVDACKKVGMPYEGNAGGDAVNPLNTSGMMFDPPEHYVGYVLFLPYPLLVSMLSSTAQLGVLAVACPRAAEFCVWTY